MNLTSGDLKHICDQI